MEDEKRVEFSIKKNGISISATVPTGYFDEQVLPVISSLLEEIATSTASRDLEHPMLPAIQMPEIEPEAVFPLTVKDIAKRLSASKAHEIMRAAAISLSIGQNREKFSRTDLYEEAKKATGYWNKTHSSSAPHVVDWLTSSGTLIETLDGQYCLSPTEEAHAADLFA